MSDIAKDQKFGGTPWGIAGVLLGAASLILALVTLYAGPFAPQPELAVSLGELAGDTIKATARELLGRPQPAPVTSPWTLDDTLSIVVVAVGVGAILCGIFAAAFGGQRAFVAGAAALGSAAIALQFLGWAVAMIVCALLVLAVFTLIGEGLSGVFG